MKNAKFTGILGQQRLEFKDNAQLERYYEEKYEHGGYEGGCTLFDLNLSRIYHDARQRTALRFLQPGPQDRILDAGCGDGTLSVLIAPQCRELHAVDIAGNALNPAHLAIPNLHFRKMNIEALDFPDGFFDKIVCVETLEHLLNPERALAEFARALRPGGLLVLTYPTINRTFMQRLHLSRPLPISEHLTEWRYAEFMSQVQAAKFAPLQVEGIVFDFGVFGWIKYSARFLARAITRAALAIRVCPRNSLFVAAAFRKP